MYVLTVYVLLYISLDSFHFEMTIHTLENKVLSMESRLQAFEDTQRSLLTRLLDIERYMSPYNNMNQLPSWIAPQVPNLMHQPWDHHSQPNQPSQPTQPTWSHQQSALLTPTRHQSMSAPLLLPQDPTCTFSAQQNQSDPKPKQILMGNNPLPSSAIQREKLKSRSWVLSKYPKLRGESKAPTLAVKLARECFFGDSVLVQCTPGGGRNLPALPTMELNQLKEVIFQQFSHLWYNSVEFESKVWTPCFNAIGQACKRLRNPC